MLQRTGVLAAEDNLGLARVALRSAHYDAAVELLDGCEDWADDVAERAVLVKAETIGQRDPVEALAYLASVEELCISAEARFGRDVESGRLHATVRNYAAAESRYADARRLAHGVANGLHTMAYHDLRMRWLRRECDPSAPEVALALAHPDPSIASAAYAYRAWLHAGNRDYAAHVADLVRAVAYAKTPGPEPVDVTTLAKSVHALAQVSFEMADANGVAAARAASDALAWTPDVRTYQFAAIRAFGWDAFMRGNPAQAQWAFKEARAVAPSATWRIMGHLDRAFVARMSGNEFWALEELAQADALAFDVAWGSSFGEERQVLVSLAVLHAPADAARAQRYATIYSQIGTENVNPAFAVHGDPRALAHARYAQGRIEQTMGRRDAAVAALSESFAIFEASSFHYRAVLAATALAELTGEERWRDAAVQHASRYPDCPLASAARTCAEPDRAMPEQLSPLQRQIARALWNGADAGEISRRFSRSLYRVERQMEAIFTAFGVTSRAALHGEAVRRGLA
ncbi:MAG: hypothetical protein JWM87_3421 [Candidatus Eremiobacteraeota bacterium]|nr:hypothetical protein [Candidatus Eremiobacteraeota bacterium]